MKALHFSRAGAVVARSSTNIATRLCRSAIVLAINLVLLLGGRAAVLAPRRGQRAARGHGGARRKPSAQAEFGQAEAVRDGKSRATADLETFYKEVLPAGRRVGARARSQSKTHAASSPTPTRGISAGRVGYGRDCGIVARESLHISLTLTGDLRQHAGVHLRPRNGARLRRHRQHRAGRRAATPTRAALVVDGHLDLLPGHDRASRRRTGCIEWPLSAAPNIWALRSLSRSWSRLRRGAVWARTGTRPIAGAPRRRAAPPRRGAANPAPRRAGAGQSGGAQS